MKILSSLQLDFHSLYTFYYRRVHGYPCRGLLLVLYLWHSMKIFAFLLSIICTETSSTSSAAILKVSLQWVVDEKNKPVWLPNWRHVISRQANFSTHEGACFWNRLVQQICPWSLLSHIKRVWYEGAKLGSKSFVTQHIFSLEIVGADEGALLRERAAGASSLVCKGARTLGVILQQHGPGTCSSFKIVFHTYNAA